MKPTTARTLLLILGLAAASPGAFAEPDRKGCTDPALFPVRMPGYYINDCKLVEFDGYDFKLPNAKKQRQEGKFSFITYRIGQGQAEPSAVAILRNYENALTQIGGKVAASAPGWWMNGSAVVDNREVWAEVERGNGQIWLRIIEKAPMKQYVVADATALTDGLKATGHVTVHGIFFDTGLAVVKPESKPALVEVAKMLQADPALRLWVVGHTDWVGKVEDNQRLAQARADAVVAELTAQHGVAAGRLKGYGAGPLAPVAGNDDEAGRAKNRRVELVKAP